MMGVRYCLRDHDVDDREARGEPTALGLYFLTRGSAVGFPFPYRSPPTSLQ